MQTTPTLTRRCHWDRLEVDRQNWSCVELHMTRKCSLCVNVSVTYCFLVLLSEGISSIAISLFALLTILYSKLCSVFRSHVFRLNTNKSPNFLSHCHLMPPNFQNAALLLFPDLREQMSWYRTGLPLLHLCCSGTVLFTVCHLYFNSALFHWQDIIQLFPCFSHSADFSSLAPFLICSQHFSAARSHPLLSSSIHSTLNTDFPSCSLPSL